MYCAKGSAGAWDALFFRISQGLMKIQGIAGNLFFKYGLREVFEAGIFGENMTGKPGKSEADNKKKSQNSGGEFWSV